MAKLPRAPNLERLRETSPTIKRIGPGLSLYRIYKRGGDYPTLWNDFRRFGPLSRFDHHRLTEEGEPFLQRRAILYAATDIPTAAAEYFQRNRRRINRVRHDPWLVAFELSDSLDLLDLTDTFCVRVGASMKLTSGPFVHAQAWSRGFFDVYSEIHGLYYNSSLTNRPVIALYERAQESPMFPATTRMHRALADPLLHRALMIVAQEIGYRLI